MNRFSFIGFLGNNAEIKHVTELRTVTRFRMGVPDGYMTKEGWKEKPAIWISVEKWGKPQELVKGQKVFVEGRIEQQTWNKKDGTEIKDLVLIATQLCPLVTIPSEHPLPELEKPSFSENDIPF